MCVCVEGGGGPLPRWPKYSQRVVIALIHTCHISSPAGTELCARRTTLQASERKHLPGQPAVTRMPVAFPDHQPISSHSRLPAAMRYRCNRQAEIVPHHLPYASSQRCARMHNGCKLRHVRGNLPRWARFYAAAASIHHLAPTSYRQRLYQVLIPTEPWKIAMPCSKETCSHRLASALRPSKGALWYLSRANTSRTLSPSPVASARMPFCHGTMVTGSAPTGSISWSHILVCLPKETYKFCERSLIYSKETY